MRFSDLRVFGPMDGDKARELGLPADQIANTSYATKTPYQPTSPNRASRRRNGFVRNAGRGRHQRAQRRANKEKEPNQ